MLDYFKEKTMLPENQKIYDDFALGWSYTFMAEGAFLQEKYDDGIEYLYKAITFFIEESCNGDKAIPLESLLSADSISSLSIFFLFLLAQRIAASFNKFFKSAPEKPGVLMAQSFNLTCSCKGFVLACTDSIP